MLCCASPSWHITSSKFLKLDLEVIFLTYSRYSSALRGRSDTISELCVVGVSAGLLAAAAVALSPAIPALIPLGVEVVLIAFRIGLLARSTAAHVELLSADHSNASWSYAVPGMTESQAKAALASFHEEKVIPSVLPNHEDFC